MPLAALTQPASADERLHRVLKRAVSETEKYFEKESAEGLELEMHKVKSVLYAAIETLGIQSERLVTIQRMLREIFTIVALQGDSRSHEKAVGLQILRELEDRLSRLR